MDRIPGAPAAVGALSRMCPVAAAGAAAEALRRVCPAVAALDGLVPDAASLLPDAGFQGVVVLLQGVEILLVFLPDSRHRAVSSLGARRVPDLASGGSASSLEALGTP